MSETIHLYHPTGALLERIETNFTYHPPKRTEDEHDQPSRYETIRNKGKELAILLTHNCPEGRELSLALTHLEEAVMWANAAIARGEK
jgi:hypothetical protein